jgi:hypothetical protein
MYHPEETTMSQPDLTSAAAAEHVRDLRTTAAEGRLHALARGCSSVWTRGARSVGVLGTGALHWLRAGQLGAEDKFCATC